jgi:hypothetical protein
MNHHPSIGEHLLKIAGSSASTAGMTRSSPTTTTTTAASKFGREGYVHPFLRPSAGGPMKRSDRKRAFANAQFYSECCILGIKPSEADLAARDADSRYNKWWVEAKCDKSGEKDNTDHQEQELDTKRRRIDQNDIEPENDIASSTSDKVSKSSSAVVSGSEDELPVKRQPPRHIVRSDALIREVQLSTLLHGDYISEAKAGVIRVMRATGGDTSCHEFLNIVEILTSYYSTRGWDDRWTAKDTSPRAMDGKWLNLAKPTFSECKGRNERGESIYTLGRVAFDMFRPVNLACSMGESFVSISPWTPAEIDRPLYYPSSLKKATTRHSRKPQMRNYE